MRTSNIRFVAVGRTGCNRARRLFEQLEGRQPGDVAGHDRARRHGVRRPPPAATAPRATSTVAIATGSKYGKILVNSKGMTLYLSDHDGKGVSSAPVRARRRGRRSP